VFEYRYWAAHSQSNWYDQSNWSQSSGGSPPASIPTPNTIVVFDSMGPGSCDLDASAFVQGFYVYPGYNRNITQNGYEIRIGTSGGFFDDGFFVGGGANISVAGDLYIGGCQFQTTDATLSIDGTFTFNPSPYIGPLAIEEITLSATDILNKRVQLAQVNVPSNVALSIVGGVSQQYDIDYYAVDDYLCWDGKVLEGYLSAGDILRVTYPENTIGFDPNNGTIALDSTGAALNLRDATFSTLLIAAPNIRIAGTCLVEDRMILQSGSMAQSPDGTVRVWGDLYAQSTYNKWAPSNNFPLIFDGYGPSMIYNEAGCVIPTIIMNKADTAPVVCRGVGPLTVKDDFIINDGTFNTNGMHLQVGL
jgi:hypothetical protein